MIKNYRDVNRGNKYREAYHRIREKMIKVSERKRPINQEKMKQ